VTILDDHPTSISGSLDALVRDVLVDQGFPDRTEVTVHTVDGAVMAERNADAFGRSEPTDVLSFPLEELSPGSIPGIADDGPPLMLGDVFIAPSVVLERAAMNGFDADSELALMAVHGVLHLIGYDHADDDAADAMESIESRILERHGWERR
jgi:probable rRNA maturation factor